MTTLDNNQIRAHVNTLYEGWIKQGKVPPEEQPMVMAVTSLVANVLCNLNDIAYCMIDEHVKKQQ